MRHVAVRPHGLLALGRPGGVHHRLLGDEGEGPLGHAALVHVPFRRRHLGHRPPAVHRARPPAVLVAPRDRSVDGVVDLERPAPEAEALEAGAAAHREVVTGDAQDLGGGGVEQHGVAPRQVADRAHLGAGLDLPAERLEVGDERVADPLRAADGRRPAGPVTGRRKDEARCGRERLRQVVDGVGGDAGPEGLRLGRREQALPEHGGRQHGPQPEGDERQRVGWQLHRRPEDVVGDVVPAVDGRADQPAPALRVADGDARLLEGLEQHPGAAVVEGVGGVDLRLRPGEPQLLERELAERRRVGAEGVDGRADVVQEAGEGQLGGPGAAAGDVLRLEDDHRGTGGGEADGSGEAVRARADHHGVVVRVAHWTILPPASSRSAQLR